MHFLLKHFVVFLALAISVLVYPVAQAQFISIQPGYADVAAGASLQYTATVVGLANTSVTWSLGGTATQVGSISPTGFYTAPSVVPSGSINIFALASDKKTRTLVYVNVAAAGPTLTSVSPGPIPVGNYAVTVNGSGFISSTIILCGGVGLNTAYVNSTTLKVYGYRGTTGAGIFVAKNPGTVVGPGFPVTFGTGTQATITPSSAKLAFGATQQFTSNSAGSWTTTAGTISPTGLYTAPPASAGSTSATVTSTGSSGTASAALTFYTVQLITPSNVSVALGQTQQFTSPNATSWTATSGTITSSGLYTAPSVLPSSGSATITASGPSQTASITVPLLGLTPIITAVSNAQLPQGVCATVISGTGFNSQSVAQLNGAPLITTLSGSSLNASGFCRQAGVANLTVANGAAISPAFGVQVGVANPLATAAAARRFLEQAAFGPTIAEATRVQTLGMQAWIADQFAAPPVSNYNALPSPQGGMPARFLTMAVSNPDQLRQRVAFALSQLFVTSTVKLIWNDNMINFQNMLLNDSFTNFRQLMSDVTLSPAMGNYLDMANNAKADPTVGSLANENYARELMQLFTLGTNLLNQDGTPQLDVNGLPIPSYSQFTVTEFARVDTGWIYTPVAGNLPIFGTGTYSYTGPLVPFPAQHDFGSKQLLNGYVSPAGVSPLQDLNNSLDNVFNHPNVGPFFGRQLIQHLVKSNPSPAYIARVAAAFNDNGSQVRGDMRATIAAVLLDPEARANDQGGNDLAGDGHQQEPALFVAGMVRAFNGSMNDQNYYPGDLAAMGQNVFYSPSVFNFYAPSYMLPSTSITAGEFQIYTPNAAVIRANEVFALFNQFSGPVMTYGPGTSLDLGPFVPLATSPAMLVDALDFTLTHGVMPAAMKSIIVSAVAADAGNPLEQVQIGCYLILTSGYYNVWH